MINDNTGLGLGLSISKGIIDAMGGHIEVDTAPGRGTEFIVTFELRLQNQEADERPLVRARRDGDRKFFSDKRILIVTDDEELFEGLLNLMRPYGTEPEWAKDGESAMNKVVSSSGRPYNLIITDFLLKDMDVYEEAGRVRALSNPVLSMIPIVVMTSVIMEDDRRAAIGARINGHLSKPVEEEALLDILKSFLQYDL